MTRVRNDAAGRRRGASAVVVDEVNHDKAVEHALHSSDFTQ